MKTFLMENNADSIRFLGRTLIPADKKEIFFDYSGTGMEFRYIGRVLTPAVIAMLTVYCFAGYVKSGCLGTSLHGLAEMVAAAVTVALHLWRRNPLLSIACGTAVYMLLVR